MGKEFRFHRGVGGPWLVTPDAVPPGAHRLRIPRPIERRRVMQDARTDQLIFGVPELIAMISGIAMKSGAG